MNTYLHLKYQGSRHDVPQAPKLSFAQWDALTDDEQRERWKESPFGVEGASHPDHRPPLTPPRPDLSCSTEVANDPHTKAYAELHEWARQTIRAMEYSARLVTERRAYAAQRRAVGDPAFTPPETSGTNHGGPE